MLSRNLLCLSAWLILQDIISFTNINTVSAGTGGLRSSLNDPPSRPLIGPFPVTPAPLIGRDGSRDLNTGLTLVETAGPGPNWFPPCQFRLSSLYGAVIWRHNAPWARPGLLAADIARCFLDWGRRGWSGPAVTRCLHISLDSEAQTRGERAPLIITSVSLSQTRALGILWDQTRAITHGNKH